MIFSVKNTFTNLIFTCCIIFEYFIICFTNELNKFTSWIEIFPIMVSFSLLLINSIKKYLDFYSLSRKKNNLIHYSVSNFCFYSILTIHLFYICGVFLLICSLMKFFEEQNRPRDESYGNNLILFQNKILENSYFNAKNILFTSVNLIGVSFTYLIGEKITRLVFYSIEKEFFPERKPNDNQIFLNQKNYNYLKYEVLSDSSERISEI